MTNRFSKIIFANPIVFGNKFRRFVLRFPLSMFVFRTKLHCSQIMLHYNVLFNTRITKISVSVISYLTTNYKPDNVLITKSTSLFSNSCIICRYVFCVVVILACPKRLATLAIETPANRSNDA